MKEEKLIQEIQNNPRQFSIVYDQYYQTIFNYCYRRTNDFSSSKDICSETFLKAFLNIKKFKWKGISIQSWLYRIATNEVNLFFRTRKYQPQLLREIYTDYPESHYSDSEEQERAEQEYKSNQNFLKVQKIISNLPLKYQEVLTLKHFENLKIKEICLVLNKKEGTVKSLLSRGIKLIKEKL